jgi:quercetin dioxygenase-like cupin family protein
LKYKIKVMKIEFETAKKANLVELIDYSKDAIVSKTLIKKETGTVTLFAFDQGQGLSEHTAPFDAMVQLVEGNGTIIIDKKTHHLQEGEFIIMPGNVPHAVEAPARFKMLLIMIKSN